MFIFVGFVISCRLRINLEVGSQNKPGKSFKQNGEGPFQHLFVINFVTYIITIAIITIFATIWQISNYLHMLVFPLATLKEQIQQCRTI